MSVMTAALMEVVLFEEGDVIVASGALGVLTAWDFDNPSYSDAHMIYNHIHYYNDARQDLYRVLGGRTSIEDVYGNPVNMEELYNTAYIPYYETPVFAARGEYSWDESRGLWVHQ